jgi:hypothetical protein
MLFTPAAMGGLFMTASKMMMMRLPLGSVPMFTDAASLGANRVE